MPSIKFSCPHCQRKIRVAATFAGKRGLCPACQQKIDIPAVAGDDDPSGSGPRPVVVVPAGASNSRNPSVPEPSGAAIQSPAAQPPAPAPAPSPTEAAQSEARAREVAEPAAGAFVKFNCPGCGKMTGFPSKLAGQPAKCPSCQARIMVPSSPEELPFIIGGTDEKETQAKPAPKPRQTASAAHHHPPPARRESASPLRVAIIAAAVIVSLLVVTMVWSRPSTPGTSTAQAPLPPVNLPPPAALKVASDELKVTPTPPLQVDANRTTPAEPLIASETAPRHDAQKNEDQATPDAPSTPEMPAPPTTPPEPQATNDVKDDLGDEPLPKPKNVDVPEPALKLTEPPQVEPPKPVPLKPSETPKSQPRPKPITVDPDGPCATCLGTGTVPLPIIKPYVRAHNDPAPDPALSTPWSHCPKCQAGQDNKELVKAEAERLTTAGTKRKDLEQEVGVQLNGIETRHVTLHAQLPAAMTKHVGVCLDKLSTQLQTSTKSTLLTQTRPDTHELVILWDSAGYSKFVDALQKRGVAGDMELLRKSMGAITRPLAFFNANRGTPVAPEHMALFQFAKMLMTEATDGKARPWLSEGFAAYCENTITQQNLCYSFVYELNEVKFGRNWDADLKKFAQQRKLKTWDLVFPLELIGIKSLDYLTCYSMVSFLIKSDAKRFVQMVQHIRDGMESQQALEKAYNKPLKDLQALWGAWTQR